MVSGRGEEPNFVLVGGADRLRSREIPAVLPVIPTRGFVVFPWTTVPIVLRDEKVARLLNDASMGDRLVALSSVISPGELDESDISPEHLHNIGTLGYVVRLFKGTDNTTQVFIQGHERIELLSVVSTVPYIRMHINKREDIPFPPDDLEAEAMYRAMTRQFSRLVVLSTNLPDELAVNASRSEDPRHVIYLIASALSLEPDVSQNLLELDSIKEKILRMTEILEREIEVLELGKKILSDTRSKIEKTQKEYLLRQQMKSIQSELGEDEESGNRAEQYRKRIEDAGMPPEAMEEALRELKRIEAMPPGSAELPMIETYVEWLIEMPWKKATPDVLDIENARETLDADHYDLEEIKERILEYLAVRKLKHDRKRDAVSAAQPVLRPEREGAILCFIGPPGVGKTSLGVSIARAMGRKFVRMSLGGLHDEAEIRGHRRTYIGSVPGRILQSIRRAGTKNPVFMLDEVDKVSADWRGDPSSALLEVLDPEQNREFRDNYLNVAFDLSQILFIATANVLETIPPPLRDRMEIVELSGYTQQEKLHIAKQYLLPRQIQENGLQPAEISFSDEAILMIIESFTREAGVRELERRMGQICRRVAVAIAGEDGSREPARIDVQRGHEILGKPQYYHDAKERTDTPGVAIGVAVTAAGGDIMFIEATRMKGRNNFAVTGQLGEIMKESAQAAFSLVRANADRLGIPDDYFERSDIHIHVPAGAIPKDGPSAGVTMATALASLATGRLVRSDVSMTGEITLRGKVLPVGGIKEKALAAHRADVMTLILPKHNEKDLDDLPEEVRNEMNLITVDNIDEVFSSALEPPALEQADEQISQTHTDEGARAAL